MLLLLLLSRFSHIRLCDPVVGSPPGSAVPGILRQESWSGLPLPSPGRGMGCGHKAMLLGLWQGSSSNASGHEAWR